MSIGEYLQGLSQQELGKLLNEIQNDTDFGWSIAGGSLWIGEFKINSSEITVCYSSGPYRTTCCYDGNNFSDNRSKILFYSRLFKLTSYFLSINNPQEIVIDGSLDEYNDSLALWNDSFFSGFEGYEETTSKNNSVSLLDSTTLKQLKFTRREDENV